MRVLIVDDHGVVRDGLSRLLSVHFKAEAFEASNVESALEKYKAALPELVILDLNLQGPGGLELLRRLLGNYPDAKVIIFSMHHEPLYAIRALRAGARGYVGKSAPVEELLAAIRTVQSGGQYVDRELASRIALSQTTNEDPLQALSLREVEILRLLGQGKSLTAISEGLGIAYKTVANICTQMKVKLGVDRTADLIRLAVETLKP
ncbi:MAG TPA: response regulator transcription factor [Hyphomicrobium sp.]|nr:response regulator transcription factor [Hyphomicrobium sp.]